RNGKITGTGAKTLVGYKEMLKDELVVVAKGMGLEIATKITKDRKTGNDKETVTDTIDKIKALIESHSPDFRTRKMVVKANKDFEYRMLAYELSNGTAPDEDPRERGHRLEPESRLAFEDATGKKVIEVGGISREDEPRIALSPDGLIKKGKVYNESFESKSLAGWKHVMIWQEDIILDEHMEQCLDYFVVNDDAHTHYYTSYCPEIEMHPIHIVKIERKDYVDEIEMMLQGQKDFLKEHDERLKAIYFK
ncbi:MAG: YqaJ viral recombinase family protein, partial [Candidatus Peribacteraceae bacterium]|nr:YqaJ viral recombinase family protein [Candidatus Peribacteraceae bacterium]